MHLLVTAASLLFSTSSLPPCNPIAGWEQVTSDSQVQWIVLGEMHGSGEMPEIFADAACLTAQSEPVVIAVEQPEFDQDAINSFIASDGGPEAQRQFLTAGMWQGAMKDGRSSEAMFGLFERLRVMHSQGLVLAVVAMQPTQFTARPTPAEYEEAMARLVRTAAQGDSRVLVLVGNLHAMLGNVPWEPSYRAMAAHLPQGQTISLNLVPNGGDSWTCQGRPVQCAEFPMAAPPQPFERGVLLNEEGGQPYSGMLYLGTASTASPPQRQELDSD